MAGKRGRNLEGHKSAKLAKITQKDSHALTPGNECKQNEDRRKKPGKKQGKAVAQVVEDEQIFEIETQGQMSDFQSEGEMDLSTEGTDSEAGKERVKAVVSAGQNRSGRVRIVLVDEEITFSVQCNNNATIVENDPLTKQTADDSLEEGECSQSITEGCEVIDDRDDTQMADEVVEELIN